MKPVYPAPKSITTWHRGYALLSPVLEGQETVNRRNQIDAAVALMIAERILKRDNANAITGELKTRRDLRRADKDACGE